MVLSLVPAVATAYATEWGGSWGNSAALVAMHVMAWGVCVAMLTRLTIRKSDADADRRAGGGSV
jgi:putative effector of murein hydrolase